MIKVLLAHQADDKDTAVNLRVKLMTPVYEKLECVLIEENPRQGGWEEDLKAKIDETNLFLFLLPGNQVDKEDWDWLIWAAAGVRWKISNGEQLPIVLLCNTSLELPSPLKTPKIHTYENDIDQLEKFLKYFYGSPNFIPDKQPLHDFLAQQPNELRKEAEGILKLFSPPKIKVFVTHKSEDLNTVESFIKIIHDYDTSETLEFILAEDIPKGEDWRQRIHDQVVDANVLLFFMISPEKDWHWCLYEAGLFTGSQSFNPSRRIIIFFNPNLHTLPSPLENLQGVKVTEKRDVETFLRQFFGTSDLTGTEPPLNSDFNNLSTVQKAANDICKLLCR